MKFERQNILNKPAWQAIREFPAVISLDMNTLRALDGFFDHIAKHQLVQPGKADFRAWADLGAGHQGLARLKMGLTIFDPQDPSLLGIEVVHAEVLKKAGNQSTSSKGRSVYERHVSVPKSEFPDNWQEFLAKLETRRLGGDVTAPSKDIQIRMAQKLGQYILVMKREGLPEELHQEGLTVFYRDVSTRISKRTGAPLRPATLRATWEELERFARLSGTYSLEFVAGLRKTLEALKADEEITTQQKYAKMHGLGGPPDIIKEAFHQLQKVDQISVPANRHKQRNRAAALGLPAILPLRREWDRIIFGKTLRWDGGRYRFHGFKPRKTALLDGRREFPGSIHPKMTPFIDALVLQGNDPNYLDSFREHVERIKRPLFVHPNGAACSKNYVTRVWSECFGTGAHIARTLMHDFFGAKGEEGVSKALIICDQYSPETQEPYFSMSLHQRLVTSAQDDILEIAIDLNAST